MKCMECGIGRMRRQGARTTHRIRGVQFEIDSTVAVCSHCGFQTIPQDRLAEHARQVNLGYRRAAGLLSAEEIRSARKSLRMSQQEFASHLGVGEASVKRWELGTLQDKSSDDLIRLRTDPDYARRNLDELRRRLGRTSPTEPRREFVFLSGKAGFHRSSSYWDTEQSAHPAATQGAPPASHRRN